MKIHGTVTDATEEKPLHQAKVVLYVGETKLATVHTSRVGVFEMEQDLDQHVGEDLICKVTIAQFKPGENVYKIGTDDIEINIKLEEPQKIEPVITPPPPTEKIEPIIEPRPTIKSRKNIFIIGGAVCAAILVVIVIYYITRPKPVKIVSFEAVPSIIDKGKSSTLKWETQNAENVTIVAIDKIGKVEFSGSKEVSPQKTTTYALIAKNEEGKRVKREVQIKVIEYKVVLFNTGANRIKVIRNIRAVTGIGLKDAKYLVDNPPQTIKDNISKAEAEEIKKQLESVGAEAKVGAAK